MERLRRWEIAALLALCVTLVTTTWAQGEQRRLSTGILRLHVLAASDSAEDQRAKLRARDAVLPLLEEAMAGAKSEAEAEAAVRALLPELARRAGEAGGAGRVTVSLSRVAYPTLVSPAAALPAGSYRSLRILLGEGQGHNWWCVIYPLLCPGEGTDEERAEATFGRAGEERAEEGGETYEIRFRLLELWDEVKTALAGE